jgi:hypothetical protein
MVGVCNCGASESIALCSITRRDGMFQSVASSMHVRCGFAKRMRNIKGVYQRRSEHIHVHLETDKENANKKASGEVREKNRPFMGVNP